VVAEGIETQEHGQYARALGATLGQGFHFGHPEPEPRRGKVTGVPLPLLTTALPHPWQASFDLASARRPVRRGTMPLAQPDAKCEASAADHVHGRKRLGHLQRIGQGEQEDRKPYAHLAGLDRQPSEERDGLGHGHRRQEVLRAPYGIQPWSRA
jgi:hypothetical protein